MIRTVIIEDEATTAMQLAHKLSSLSSPVEVMATLASVRESVEYFSNGCHADLIFSDVQLPDGLAFTIFEEIRCDTPVIFITGLDNFIMNAFEHNGIDYLLKPFDEKDLAKVMDKYKTLEKHFKQRQSLVNLFGRKKERLIVKKGTTNVLLRLDDVVFFYTENKIVYVVDRDGRKFVCDQNLSELENVLDNNTFFRANRKHLINVHYVKSYRTLERVKLSVDICCHELNYSVVVSQETAPYFRRWLHEK